MHYAIKAALQVDSLAITTSGTVALYGDNEIGTLAMDHVGGGEGSVSVTDLDGPPDRHG